MAIEIHPATPQDAPALAEVFLSAFCDSFSRSLFPLTADVREWWVKLFIDTSVKPQPGDILLKAVDTSAKTDAGDEVITAFAIWNLPPSNPDAVNQIKQDALIVPESCNKGLCDRFFGRMEEMREKIVGGRRHYYLDMLGTHPDYHGRGIGSKLLKWGLEKADQDNLEAYLSASPWGRPLYEKNGFKILHNDEFSSEYTQAYMLRPRMGSGERE